MVSGQADGLAGGWGLELGLLSGLPQSWQRCMSPGCCPGRSLSPLDPGSRCCTGHSRCSGWAALGRAKGRSASGTASTASLCQWDVAFPVIQRCVGV